MIDYPTRNELIATVAGNGAEIGVYRGAFSAVILSNPAVTHLHLIDCWEYQDRPDYQADAANVNQGGHDENYRVVCRKFGRDPRVSIHRGYSQDIAARFADNALDWVYIDANHTYDEVLADLTTWSRKARILCGHDYSESPRSKELGFGVVAAVTSFCSACGWTLTAVSNEEWPSYRLDCDS